MEKLLQGAVFNYLKCREKSIEEIIYQIEGEEKVLQYIYKLLRDTQKNISKSKSFEEIKEIFEKYIHASREYIFSKKELDQFNEIIINLLLAFKYCVETKPQPARKENKPRKEIQTIYDLFKEKIEGTINKDAYKSQLETFIRAHLNDDKIVKSWRSIFDYFTNHDDSEEIKENDDNFNSQITAILEELWKKHHR